MNYRFARGVSALAMFVVVSLGGPAAAQTAATGSIEGIVIDATGGVLPGVSVIVRNMDTNAPREVVTDGEGRYRAVALQPGRYEVSATLAGFFAAPIGGLEVQVGQTLPVDVKMRPAGVTEEVIVTGESSLIETRSSAVSNVVSEDAIENLPINGRRWENFVLLSPGVTNDGNFGLVSYRGISGLYNNNMVDGVDNNQAFFSEARGRTRAVYTISQSAIREFQVGISNMSAEFGRAAGGTVNAVTKSGTNRLRGEGFYFRRDDELQAREPTITAIPGEQNPRKPEEMRQQFGLSIGGPIQRDRVFYFANYDQQLRDFPGFVRTNSATFFEQACTAPGCEATRQFFRGQSGFFPREGNNRIFLGKIDTKLSTVNDLSVQYNLHRWKSPNGIQTQPILTGTSNTANGTDLVETDFLVASLRSVFGSRWLNEARVQIGRDFEAQTPNAPGPSTTVGGGISFGMPNFLPRPKYPEEWRYQFVNVVSYLLSRHSVRAGADMNYVREDLINLFQGGGVYSYSGLQTMAADCPNGAVGCARLADATPGRHYSTYTQAFDLRGLAGDVFFTTTDYNFFIQDTWTVDKALSLNLGMRYEYQRLPQPGESEVRGTPLAGNPAYPRTMRFNQDTNNWGPRLGATYDVGGAHATVIRGAYGLFFGRTSNSAVSSALTNNAVTFATYSLNPTSPGAPTYPNVLTAPPNIAGARPAIQYLVEDLQRPTIHMADVGIQRQISPNMAASVTYLFSRGRHLPTFIDTNLPAPSAQVVYTLAGQTLGAFPFYRGTRPDANIGAAIEVRDDVESTYHGLVLQAQRRFSEGLLFNANYTLSKATDTGQNSTTFISNFPTVFDPLNLELERGTSNFDRRHRFVTSFHYAPDFFRGFQVGGVLILESGLPLDPTISATMTGTGAVSTGNSNGTGGSFRAPFLERNSFRQDGRKTFDLRLSKSIRAGGRRAVVVLWEAFNIFNWVNYTGYSNIRYRGTGVFDAAANRVNLTLTEDTGFGRPTSASNTLWGARDMQVGLKFFF